MGDRGLSNSAAPYDPLSDRGPFSDQDVANADEAQMMKAKLAEMIERLQRAREVNRLMQAQTQSQSQEAVGHTTVPTPPCHAPVGTASEDASNEDSLPTAMLKASPSEPSKKLESRQPQADDSREDRHLGRAELLPSKIPSARRAVSAQMAAQNAMRKRVQRMASPSAVPKDAASKASGLRAADVVRPMIPSIDLGAPSATVVPPPGGKLDLPDVKQLDICGLFSPPAGAQASTPSGGSAECEPQQPLSQEFEAWQLPVATSAPRSLGPGTAEGAVAAGGRMRTKKV